MGNKGKNIKCDCGGVFNNKIITLEGITCSAMVCSKCEEKMFSMEQSTLYHKLKNIQNEIVTEKRKISRIGNSMGITLPVKLKELGFNVGEEFKLSVLDENKIIIELI